MLTPVPAKASSIPKPDAKLTISNIMAILNKYDKNGADFLNNAMNSGENVLVWWDPGDSILDSIDTAVHETCHSYTNQTYGSNQTITRRYRIDDCLDHNITWNKNDILYCNEMAERIPTSMQYHRYDTYIGGYDCLYSDANQFGVYGLLNEFNAYGWGLHTDICMYHYLCDVKSKSTAKKWLLGQGSNNIDAYAEFKYWFYRYMLHTKSNYPDVYRSIAENADFILSYMTVEKRFSKSINDYIRFTKDSYTDYYKKVKKELSKSKYSEIHSILSGKKVDLSGYKWNNDLHWTSIYSITPSKNGVLLRWRPIDEADGYLVYRTSTSSSELISDQKNCTYDDVKISYGKTLSYYIIPYQLDNAQNKIEGKPSVTRSIYLIQAPKMKAVSFSNEKIKSSWNKVNVADGYEISFTIITSSSSNGTSHFETSSTKTYYISNKTLSVSYDPPFGRGYEYQVSVRAYQFVNKTKIYSQWSEIKKIKV